LTTYKHGRIFYEEFKAEQDRWEELGKISSLSIYVALLRERQQLFNTGHYFCTILGAGSCKLCEKCTFPCSHPEKSIIPLEGTGIDVVATLKKHNIDIKFPIKDYFYRIGMILYD
jgi:predicted metal-binding protein